MARVAVFCGSKMGARAVYRETAEAMARELARRKVGLVYGGGNVGLMGVMADEMIKAKGEVIGVIPGFMVEHEVAHRGVTRLEVVSTMHERKARLAELADVFLALPGGYGTLDELFEIITWAQLQLHRKPIGLLNVEGYFDPLVAWVERAVAEGFISVRYRGLFEVDTEGARLIETLLCGMVPQGVDTQYV